MALFPFYPSDIHVEDDTNLTSMVKFDLTTNCLQSGLYKSFPVNQIPTVYQTVALGLLIILVDAAAFLIPLPPPQI